MTDTEEKKWYIMRVHNMAFNRARARLQELGLDYFVPEVYAINVSKGRKVKELVPAVKDFFFIYSTRSEIASLIAREQLPLTFYFSHTSHKQNDALTVRKEEMEAFIRAATAVDRLPQVQPYGEIILREGDLVKILSGPFEGVEGYYTQPRRGMKKRLVLTLANLLTVNIAIEPDDLIEHL